ncbi:hypothetical protein HYS28_03975 [Candidatus Uhrbacteria bacterium]|nr:hypothetical protein [Candidatus Uhrbacteria bacterium]
MLARLLTFRQARPLAYLLAILGAGIVFLLTAQSAFAANTISTSKYEESGTADGTLDRIRFAMDENVTACTYESGDWSIDAAGTVGLTAITAVSCTTLDVNLDITATFTANITGGAVNPQIDYNNQGQPNSIYLTSGAMTNKLNQAITDGAKPQANAFTYADNDGDGKIDRVTITWSEEVAAGSVIAKNDLTFQNVGDFTGIAFGTDNTDLITGSTSTTLLDLTAGAGAAEATALDTADSGSIRIDSQNAWSITDGTNANTTLGSQSAIATYTDGAKPVISTFDYSDADDDGKVDTITVNYTETVTAASVLAANDLTLSAVGDFTSLAFGANSTDLITGSVTSTAITLGTESTVKDTEDNAGTLAITSQNLFSLTDGTNTNADLEAQAQATAVDEAKPVITAFDYQDADDDGKIDTIVTNFSEEVVAGSVLRPADLTFSAVGDFTAAAFGARLPPSGSGSSKRIDGASARSLNSATNSYSRARRTVM